MRKSTEKRLGELEAADAARGAGIDAALDEAERLIASGEAGPFPGWNSADPADYDLSDWTEAHYARAVDIMRRWEANGE